MANWMDRFDLPDELIPARSLVEIMDDSRVLIEQHKGVTQYSHDSICVRVRCGTVCVTGSCLELKRMVKGQLIISGRIHCVRLERMGK